MNVDERTELAPQDRELVDLVTAALVDPNVHTDTRMRLQTEITDVLRATDNANCPAGRKADEESLDTRDRSAVNLLESVLIDPDLHTDLRLRLHNQITEIVKAAR